MLVGYWVTANRLTYSVSEHRQYIDAFCQDFKHTLESMILRGIATKEQTEVKDALHAECIQHIKFAQEKCKVFHGREDFLNKIKDKLTNNDGR